MLVKVNWNTEPTEPIHKMSEVTHLLTQISSGDPLAVEELWRLVYNELRGIAAAKLAQEKPGHTLQATALVHESYLRLLGPGGRQASWDNRGHFFAAAAEAMRRILVDAARGKATQKRGGDARRCCLEEVAAFAVNDDRADDDLLALDESLTLLEQEDPIKARLVELRYFAGLTNEQAAQSLGISTATAKRYWVYARAWLFGNITGQ